MALTFRTFKQAIPAAVLSRGRSYYTTGRVVDLSLDGDDEWTAVVEGADRYEVTIRLDTDGSLICACDCPYEYGSYCKHIAAVLYAVEETFPEYVSDKARKPVKKRLSKLDKLRAALEKMPADELRALLLSLAAADRELLNQLLIRLDAIGERATDVREIVRAALRPPPGSRGFLEYRDAMNAATRVLEMLSRADGLTDARPEQALLIYQVTVEETVKALASADDSSGSLGGIVEHALEGIDNCAALLPPHGRDALFYYHLRLAADDMIAGWHWRWDFLGRAAALIATPEQRTVFEEALQSHASPSGKRSYGDFEDEYRREKAAEVRLEMIRRLDGEDAAWQFIEEQVSIDRFRLALIRRHLEQGGLEAARALARERIMTLSEEGGKRGLVLDYLQEEVEIARAQGDRRAVIEGAAVLWQQGRGNQYYALYREYVPATDWPEMHRRLLTHKETPSYLAAWAYAQDGLWNEVREIALRHPHLIEPYRQELEKRFPEAIATVYQRQIDKLLENVSNRATYQEAASYLSRLKNMGQSELAAQIARGYIERFPQRRAMIEELRKAL